MLDSHCHLNDDSLCDKRAGYNKIAKEAGVSLMLRIGWDLDSSKKAIQIAHEFDGVYAAVGFHPENLEGISDEALEDIKELAKDEKVIAIGGIGIDYHWLKEQKDHDNQKVWSIKQIKLANELNLPLSIHAREDCEDTFHIL